MILTVSPQAQLGDLTLSDLFFESREPPNDEFSLNDRRTNFPEGQYTVTGVDFEGTPRVGTARFTHDIAVEPEITAPEVGEEPEVAPTVSTDRLIVRWEPVTEAVAGGDVEITAYEVIVTKEEHEDPDGFSRPVYDVHVPSDITSLSVPVEFLEPDTVYELEVIAIEASGNQTISVGFFRTE
ncbi:MAG: fibronectin type III domain-containing protein [Chloroflexi bacterium]|nr:fibronectin type III domain-containing protein [Chloroflexota bacterium]MDA1145162.1 fibronectin type III domain-containing protein [Chloroflexota bacterium]